MILLADELQWVSDRMKVYGIKYQEIYNELFDHILTAIEDKRKDGDERDIMTVFQDVVDSHFGGYQGIEEVATSQEKVYIAHIRKSFRKILRSYFNWKLLLFTVVALMLTFKLHNVKLMHNMLLVIIFLFAISPMVYTYITITKNVKVAKGRRSLLKGQLLTQAYQPISILNGALYLLKIFFVNDDTSTGYKLLGQLPLLTLVMIFSMLLNLSIINLCNQIIKKETI
ncbi:MAG: hypothetical protein JWP67_945 [Mucilaginibacter sp.]|nr:hypothetical protein [Mucilaginibacter sp.]